MSDMVSAESIKAQMPHVTLMRILGEPSHCQLKQLEHKLTANLMAVPCLGDTTKAILGSSRIWSFIYNTMVQLSQFRWLHHWAYPVIVAGATTAKREEQCANNISAFKA
jgi:hypothetical protein